MSLASHWAACLWHCVDDAWRCDFHGAGANDVSPLISLPGTRDCGKHNGFGELYLICLFQGWQCLLMGDAVVASSREMVLYVLMRCSRDEFTS